MMGIDASGPLGSDADYQPARITGFERFPLAPYLERAGWQRPDDRPLRATGSD